MYMYVRCQENLVQCPQTVISASNPGHEFISFDCASDATVTSEHDIQEDRHVERGLCEGPAGRSVIGCRA